MASKEQDQTQITSCSLHGIVVAGVHDPNWNHADNPGDGGHQPGVGTQASGEEEETDPAAAPAKEGERTSSAEADLSASDPRDGGDTWENLLRRRGDTEPDHAITGVVALYENTFAAYLESSESGLGHALALAKILVANKSSNLVRFKVVFTCFNLKERLFLSLTGRRFHAPTWSGARPVSPRANPAPSSLSQDHQAAAGTAPAEAGGGGSLPSSSFSSAHRNPREAFTRTMLNFVIFIRGHSTMSVRKALDLMGEKHSSHCLPSLSLVEAVLSDPSVPSESFDTAAAGGNGRAAAGEALVLDEDVVWPAPSESFLLHMT